MGADYKNTVFEVFANLTKLNIERYYPSVYISPLFTII